MSASDGENRNGRAGDAGGSSSDAISEDNPLIAPLPALRLPGAEQIPWVIIGSAEREYRNLILRLFSHQAKRVDASSYEQFSRELFEQSKGILDLVPRIPARRAAQRILGASGVGKSFGLLPKGAEGGGGQAVHGEPVASKSEEPKKKPRARDS